MAEKNIFNYLTEIGCCLNCCARYLNLRNVDFSNPKAYFSLVKLHKPVMHTILNNPIF